MTTIALTSRDRNRTLACNGVLTAVRLKPPPGDRLIMLPFGMVGFVGSQNHYDLLGGTARSSRRSQCHKVIII
jgi:hypothetical protein